MIPPQKKFNIYLVERLLSGTRERVPDQRQYIFAASMKIGLVLMVCSWPARMRVESL